MKHRIEEDDVKQFTEMLREQEKSRATIETYTRSVNSLRSWIGKESEFDKTSVIAFKEQLRERYKLNTANKYIVSLNSFFKFMGWHDCSLTTYKLQRKTFRDADKEISIEEYERILEAARHLPHDRLFYLIQTIASTGIRVGELPFITVESLSQKRSCIYNKGKYREILIPSKLCVLLKEYCQAHGIRSGSIFVTSSRTPLDRSGILKTMKRLSLEAGVSRDKLYPHNFRHFFAVNYYNSDRDIVHLADLLGHSNLNTTRMYTQISAEQQRTILDEVEERFIVKHG